MRLHERISGDLWRRRARMIKKRLPMPRGN